MKFAELNSQVFYDAIARFAAGLVLTASIVALWRVELNPLLLILKDGFIAAPTTITLTILAFAYVLAIWFEGARYALRALKGFVSRLKYVKRMGSPQKMVHGIVCRFEIARKILAQIESAPPAEKPEKSQWSGAWRDFAKVFPKEATNEPPRPSEAIAIDVLRVLNPAVGSRIVKLRAEAALCRTLSAGGTVLIIGLVLHMIWGLTFADAPSLTVGMSLSYIIVVAVLAHVFGYRQRSLSDRQLRALYNHWLLLVSPGVPGMPDSQIEE